LVAWLGFSLARWVIVTADWAIVRVNLRLFMVGRFPSDQLWRLWVSGYAVAAAGGLAGVAVVRAAGLQDADDAAGADEATDAAERPGRLAWLHRFWPALLAVVVILGFTRTLLPTLLTLGLAVPFLAARAGARRVPARHRRWLWLGAAVLLLAGFEVIVAGPDGVGWDRWGGFHLAIVATVAGILLAFPLGLLLALGRRSSLPALRVVSIGYIEALRAVPLVTLLFVGQYMIGFLFPTWAEPPSFLVRAIIAITLFEAAYIAEIVRGGLQAVPTGQIEAAQAIGLAPAKVLRLVVLPQALRAVIPAMVGQFISLYKDTSLLSILSFFELMTVAETVTKQDAFLGQNLSAVTLAFAGFLYWAGSSTMARESRRLERRLGVGER
ncbi:MAG TPA: amino acid ABC transporter permease, partial [Acidimicrobiales bacterium]|nr:amino acid ABC transporter permease [Acidimicrobiales bacterium]